MKYLRNLPNHNAYEAFINGLNYAEIQLEKNDIISYCKIELHIHYNPYIPPSTPPPTFLDILYSDANGNLSFTSEVLPISEGKTPIALCIAPPNFFGNNEPARWMSLKYMSNSSPFTGSNELNMCCGNKQVDLSITNMQTTHDSGAASGYMLVSYRDNSSLSNTIPNVINLNDEWNLSELGTVNTYAVTDKDGKSNTAVMLAATSSLPNWETDTSITNDGDHAGYSPAACVCARYHTLGTLEGDWYLGSCGEMAMLIALKTSIRSKFEDIANVYENGECYTSVMGDNQYLTSTEYNADNIYSINLSNASINCIGKDSNSGVIALLQYFIVSAVPNNIDPNNSEPVVLAAPSLLDILYSDANGNLSYSSNILAASAGKTPIALCIAPPNFFGANEPARWMSLKYMDITTPETGSINVQGIYWGNNNLDISAIDNVSNICKDRNNTWGYLTADWISGTENKVPSLFDANDDWNISALGKINEYKVTDIDGKNKTSKILKTVTALVNWQTDTTITNNSNNNYAPAACCCARYHTLGTNAGDWYFGASGEMSLLIVLKNEINAKLAQINAIYASDCISSLAGGIYYTSTEYDTNHVCGINSESGLIGNYYKHETYYIIGLLQYYVEPILAAPLDILYSDVNGNLSFTSSVLPTSEGKTPVALCIAEPGFFGTNEPGRWMSLKYMNYDTPEAGALSAQNIHYGCMNNDISTIINIQSAYNNGSSTGYINVDYNDNSSLATLLPNILNDDNKWNISVLGAVNQYAVTDIDGKNKTIKTVNNATEQADWLTDTSIINNSSIGYTPATCCCARYHTLGTNPGDWYLGACGEMCIMIDKKTDINTKLNSIYTIYPNNCIRSFDYSFWTSTEYDANRMYYINAHNGQLNASFKNGNLQNIALLQYLVNPILATPLDILYSDANGNLSFTSEILPVSAGKTPIAICIAGTNFFGYNEPARWMSLKYMNYTTPETGSLSTQNMYWGNGDTNVTTINDITKTYFNGIDHGYILVDYSDNTSLTNILPDVLTADNKWNISNLGTINQYAMTDIDGKNKTEKILATATGQVDWLTDTTIENNSAANYTPAACCCARYHTLGTLAGDWYLGACGELCQILINKTNINTKLAAISAIYSTDSINSLLNNYLWTSTESGGNIVYRVNTTNAYLTCYDYFGKKNNSYVIALLQY